VQGFDTINDGEEGRRRDFAQCTHSRTKQLKMTQHLTILEKKKKVAYYFFLN